MSSCQEAAHGLRRPLADRDRGAREKQERGKKLQRECFAVLSEGLCAAALLVFAICFCAQVSVYFFFAKVCEGIVIGFNTLLIKLTLKETFFLFPPTSVSCCCFD